MSQDLVQFVHNLLSLIVGCLTAIIGIFIVTSYQMCVKGVALSDEPPDNYLLNLQHRSASQSFIVSFSSFLHCLDATSLFWFSHSLQGHIVFTFSL